MSDNNFDPVNEKHEAHEQMLKRFGSFEAYFDFVLKRQEEQIKQGVQYVDFSRNSRENVGGNVFIAPTLIFGEWKPTFAEEPTVAGFIQQQVHTRFPTT